MKLAPRSLFGRTAITIALTLLVFMAISMGAAVYFIAIPMAERSADDFAAVIVSAAHTMESLPEEMHAQLQHQLLLDHGLIVTKQKPTLSEKAFDVPYYVFFRESLARRAGQELAIIESEKGPIVWVDVPTEGHTIRMGFDRERLGTNPPIVLILAIGVGALLTLLTSLTEVRRVVRPLARMSAAVEEVGRGHTPPALSEDGPEEIATLARAFNQMSSDITALAENRTVIVAGISHDLRTPLTRLGLAVEMLGEDSQPELIAGIRRDLAAMKSLIGQFLQFSQGLEHSNPVDLDLERVLEAQAADLRRDGTEVQVSGCGRCPYLADPIALQRLLANLMENAAHHGGGEPVLVQLRCDERGISIEICDRGPGIPADQVEAVFRPFHRLEMARSNRTGGSGLGLAIARQLADKHGWTIELLPREGGGTVAKVVLSVTCES
ncbi:MAG: ATP-binding protein [Woeseiaceae bacterium]|nr:ATP-binding protein [Woeseiaceae bacterium]MDX2609327.1 ATP-binding protein [Woeseiaceae bacterium]